MDRLNSLAFSWMHPYVRGCSMLAYRVSQKNVLLMTPYLGIADTEAYNHSRMLVRLALVIWF